MKTKLKPGTPSYVFRKFLDERFQSKEEAAILMNIPLYRLRSACRGEFGRLTVEDLQKLAPMMTEDTLFELREMVLP